MDITKIFVTESDIEWLAKDALARMLEREPKLAVLAYIDKEGNVYVSRIRSTVEQAVCLLEASKQTEMQIWGEKIE